ncbi:MAG: molybdenum cofactor biosynthesis protein [Planctomycetaceae bacterium]|nr:molybdenum cofactor biosynthesis protein [Planctomycetaceae bacterium]
MRGFSHRATVATALAWLDAHTELLASEPVALADSVGRVLVIDIVSDFDVPTFSRSMMDGFAVQAADTLGAAPYNRLPLRIVGEVFPGAAIDTQVQSGEAVKIMTGAPIPSGADAVLPAEKVDIEEDRVLALGDVSPGKHIGLPGEDIKVGTTVLSAGRRLRPQDVGVLSSIGVAEVAARRKPRVRIVVTGNELLPPGSKPEGCKIVDANSPMLAGLVERDGGIAINPGIVSDNPDAILEALRDDADVILVSGGSSVGQEDHAPALVAQHGELGIHGVAMRPSSPAGMGVLDGRLVFLLPGNPVSCLCAYDFFAGRAIRSLGGRRADWPYQTQQLPLRRKLVSTVGRLDYARVQVIDNEIEPLAISGASILSSTTRADGFVLIPEDSEGYAGGTNVTVYLYDS